MKKTLIPEDNSIESIRVRERIIREFYREWKEKNNRKGIFKRMPYSCPNSVEEVYIFM